MGCWEHSVRTLLVSSSVYLKPVTIMIMIHGLGLFSPLRTGIFLLERLVSPCHFSWCGVTGLG